MEFGGGGVADASVQADARRAKGSERLPLVNPVGKLLKKKKGTLTASEAGERLSRVLWERVKQLQGMLKLH